MTMPSLLRSALLSALALMLLAAPLALAQEEGKKPSLILESVKIEPASPKAETLCRLSVTLRNPSDRRASGMEFAVKVNGREIPAYKDRLYLVPIEPGASKEIQLFNFWSSESGRPAPADGKLAVEVTLRRASWMSKEAKDGAEVWTPLGLADGLPLTQMLSMTLGQKPPR